MNKGQIFCLFLILICSFSVLDVNAQSTSNLVEQNKLLRQLSNTFNLMDGSINSINSLHSLVKKENYRNKITALNNPTSSEMGFNLETEIQLALKPLLEKAKTTNTTKFSSVVSSLLSSPAKNQLSKTAFGSTGIFSSLVSLVGNLTVSEKRISRQDLDSFVINISKYFVQYERLQQANLRFDQNIDKFSLKIKELQFDMREYMLDIAGLLHKDVQRASLKSLSLEELQLKYLNESALEKSLLADSTIKYPGDGIKTAKEIVYGIQKLFTEYQKIYGDNYQEIKTILLQSKDISKTINVKQVDVSVAELTQLYNDSREADILNLRINTLNDRLRTLVVTEQLP